MVLLRNEAQLKIKSHRCCSVVDYCQNPTSHPSPAACGSLPSICTTFSDAVWTRGSLQLALSHYKPDATKPPGSKINTSKV